MNKKILSLFFALSLLTTQTAQSHTEILGGELEFNVGVASNYVNRGVEQNKGQPAPFAGADFSYPIKTLGVNVYVGTWLEHAGCAKGQRGAKLQPASGCAGLGT